MDREAWHAAIHRVAKSRTRLSDWTELNWKQTKLQTCRVRSSQKKKKKRKKVGMLRPAQLWSLSSLFSRKKWKKLTPFFFFSLFTPTNSPIILFLPYQWRKGNTCHSCHCLAENKTSVLLCLKIISCCPGADLFSYFKFSLRDMNPKKSFLGWRGIRWSIFRYFFNADMGLIDPI